MSMSDGTLVGREKGTPQGAVVSPILANLFLHYAFDRWMKENKPDIPFERYADDAICHCRSEAQALSLRQALEARLAACKLELHPQKTKIVYCKDSNRLDCYPEHRFDFLGFTFRPRQSMNRAGKLFVSFSPAVSDKAAKAMREVVRRWKLHHRNDLALGNIAQWARPILVGWVNYYGRFHRLPRGLNRVIGRLSDMILMECAQSSLVTQGTSARTVASSINRLSDDEFPMLTENAEAIAAYARRAPGFRPPRPESARNYAVTTVEILRGEIERDERERRHDDEDGKRGDSATLL